MVPSSGKRGLLDVPCGFNPAGKLLGTGGSRESPRPHKLVQLPALLVFIAVCNGHGPALAVIFRVSQGNCCCVGAARTGRTFPLAPWVLCEILGTENPILTHCCLPQDIRPGASLRWELQAADGGG